MSDQLQSPLFSTLSPELRIKIYDFYLHDLEDRHRHGPLRYWGYSKRPEKAFLMMPVHHTVPALLFVCKRIHAELVLSVFDHFSISAAQVGWSMRGGVGVWGRLDLARKRKVTIVHHERTSMADWLPLFQYMTCTAARAGWFESACQFEGVEIGDIPVASQLEEVVLDWEEPLKKRDAVDVASGNETDPQREEEEREAREYEEKVAKEGQSALLLYIAGLKTVKAVRFRGAYPAWWHDFLRQKASSTLKVFCE